MTNPDTMNDRVYLSNDGQEGSDMTDKKRLFISFSGGETSAYMTQLIMNSDYRSRYDEVVIVFANTGQENEQTLDFVERCDKYFGWQVHWVEAVVYPGRKSPGGRKVSFETASREGEPFEQAIKKYGIPNSKFKDCTRNLKLNPMISYLRGAGWKPGSYDTAIGIRVDEIDRVSSSQKDRRIVYPLIQWRPTTKPQINEFWRKMPFRLQLAGYQGNCKWCWKKSMRKHFQLIDENPAQFDFPRRMEREYGLIGPEFHKKSMDRPLRDGYSRTFFRGNLSVDDLFRLRDEKGSAFVPPSDDAQVFDATLDLGGGCEESCEVFADEDDKR